MNFEKKVKGLYPEAKPYMGVMGWGIQAPGCILAIARFKTANAAWRHAWQWGCFAARHPEVAEG